MKQQLGHLACYQVTLTTLSPVFIGSGQELNKKEYIVDEVNKKVLIPDLNKMAMFLIERDLLKRYQAFMLSGQKSLRDFLWENGVKPREQGQFVDYALNNALDSGNQKDDRWQKKNPKTKGLQLFCKDGAGNPYIPGSSLKGALRTAILHKKLLAEPEGQKQQRARELGEALERKIKDFERELGNVEKGLLNTLPYRKDSQDAVNSVLKGIAVSDSAPIAKERLIMTCKEDLHSDGKMRTPAAYRECLMPQTEVTFTLTLDKRITEASGIDVAYIKDAVRKHYQWQREIFVEKFPLYTTEDEVNEDLALYLGGGVGFVNKTILHAAAGEAAGLRLTAKIMQQKFRLHKHEKDATQYEVSPHTKKMTQYQNKYYQMGLCRLEIEE